MNLKLAVRVVFFSCIVMAVVGMLNILVKIWMNGGYVRVGEPDQLILLMEIGLYGFFVPVWGVLEIGWFLRKLRG